MNNVNNIRVIGKPRKKTSNVPIVSFFPSRFPKLLLPHLNMFQVDFIDEILAVVCVQNARFIRCFSMFSSSLKWRFYFMLFLGAVPLFQFEVVLLESKGTNCCEG